ncbi:hypothetical protein QZN11_34420 [Streptomyces gramineus]|uniref:hypothetical protein n=1 Tax=Streptomyces gramineus TaxID=910542 RepID=UPI00398B8BC3
MKMHRRKSRTGLTAAAAVVVAAAAAVLVPYYGSASAPRTVSIVYDPGPKQRCYSVSDETGGKNYGNESADCANIADANRVNAACTWFGYTSARGVECPAWRFVTYNWDESRLRQYPGYDHQVQGPSGSPLRLVLQNDARTLRTARNAQDCGLKEVTFSYEYIGSSLKRPAGGGEYQFSDGRVKVAYDALVKQTGGFSCAEKRAILTTDFIYKTARGTNVISVVHFDPGSFSRPDADGVLWSNHCRTSAGKPDGCRITVHGQALRPGKRTRIGLDFTALAKKYGKYLGDDPVPKKSQIVAVQVVNSVRGADLRAEISKAAVTLTK